MKRMIVAAAILTAALIWLPDVQAQVNGTPVSTFLQTESPGVSGKKWKVVTVELGPGAVDSRSIRPGTGLVYVLDGGGLLELDGKATIGLRPGTAAALNPEKPHVLKNTSETGTLRVLVVSLQEKGQRFSKP
jgi:quercetin dioxygenase-like cupin family protein